MSNELFEVAFSGQIKDGADLEQVKSKVGAMFKADATKLAHLFSGKRMVIKKNIDQAMANKYKAALDSAGAVCEIKSLSDGADQQSVAQSAQKENNPKENNQAKIKPAESVSKPVEAKVAVVSNPVTAMEGDVPAAPQTDPLGITAGDISELSAGLAPVGSDMQDEIETVAEPQLDISAMDMAPTGSDLGEMKKSESPPPPNTDGLSLVD